MAAGNNETMRSLHQFLATVTCYDRMAVVVSQHIRHELRFVSQMHAVRVFPVRTNCHTMAHLLCSLREQCCAVAAQHEATMLYRLGDLAEVGIVPGLVGHGPALGGALYYLASTLVVGGRPFAPEPSRYGP